MVRRGRSAKSLIVELTAGLSQHRSWTHLPYMPANSQITSPIAQFLKIHINETADEWTLTTKVGTLPSAEVGHSWPQPPPSFSSSNESYRWERCRKHRKASTSTLRDHTSKEEQRDWYFTTSSDRNKRTTSSSHDSLILNLSENVWYEELSKPLVTATEQRLPVSIIIERY